MSFRWLIVCLFPVGAHAAPLETMAWHFPTRPNLDFLAENFEHINDPADAKSPGISVFTPKDQLVKDFSEPFRKHFNLGQDSWLVWNESRKLLVAHGIPVVLWQIETNSNFFGQPEHLGITLSWYLGIEPGQPVPADAKPQHQAEIDVRSGMRAYLKWESPEIARFKSTQIEVEPTFGPRDRTGTSQFRLEWKEQIGERILSWNCSSSAAFDYLTTPSQILAQADSPLGGSWTVTSHVSLLPADGYPTSKGRLFELGGKEVIVDFSEYALSPNKRKTIQTSKGPVVVETFTGAEAILNYDQSSGEQDPFADKPAVKKETPEVDPKMVVLPDELIAHLGPSLIDVSDKLRAMGVVIGPSGFAGIAPRNQRLVVGGLDPVELDKVEQLMAMCNLGPPPNVTILEHIEFANSKTTPNQLRSLIICPSGNKSTLECKEAGGASMISLEVEPTLGDSHEIIDLRYSIKRASPAVECNSSLTLPVGVEVKGQRITTESGETMTQSWKATVTHFDEND